MSRLSHLFLPTERQAPADAEAISHQLMVRAGLVRQVGAGLWSWLPAGWRVHQNIVQVIREEMDAIGGQELLLPVMLPADLWKRSGRWESVGDELIRFQDRKGADMMLAMTHEEAVTFHVAQSVRSYRDLPLLLYHFQTKGRDEARPRAGVLRTREFVMKDAYSFDRDDEGLDASYEANRGAYARIYDRCGLEWFECESDVGMMGGSRAHEYMAPCPAGEDDVVLAPGYAANLEIATADPAPVGDLPAGVVGELATPGLTTIEAVSASLGVAPGHLVKAFPVVTESRGLVMVFVRGDHQVAPTKLTNVLGEAFRPAGEEELPGPAGFLGPDDAIPAILDAAITPGRWIVGANRPDLHRVLEIPAGERADVRLVAPGDTIGGTPVRIEPAIEVGNIFKLGTRYSDPLKATFLDADGKEQTVVMGCYGIGPARIAAAAVEQAADEKGITWPEAIAPWQIELVALGKPDTPERAAAEALYAELTGAGFTVLIDDRPAGPGEKFADAELLGCPLRLTLGKRSLDSGTVEAQVRRDRADVDGGIPLEGAAKAVQDLWPSLR